MIVQYEELINYPEDTLKAISNFLELTFDYKMLDYIKENSNEVYEPLEFLEWKSKLNQIPDKKNIGKYKELLSSKEIKVFEKISSSELAKFGYDAGLRLRVNIGRVLMRQDFTTDARRFEDVHRLDDRRILEADTFCNLCQLRRTGELVEHWIQVMHGMAHLVQGVLFPLPEFAIVVERAVLEEKANLVARLDEIVVRLVFVTFGREHAANT